MTDTWRTAGLPVKCGVVFEHDAPPVLPVLHGGVIQPQHQHLMADVQRLTARVAELEAEVAALRAERTT